MRDAGSNTDDDVPDPEPQSVDAPIHVESTAHFESLVADHDPVLVDLYADWCGPCKMLEPVVAALAAETPAVVATVDVDQRQQLAQALDVHGIPTVLLYDDGDQVERLVGMRDESTLRELVARYV
ncbi:MULTISPECIES: thioredoxin family protein [Haloarcula]|uniref:thioredoxin family protein n=1 Tax=Haloarcula TaxID=2237 RepID=UPI0023ECD22D|nr:thioredoxin family protein [Halomicroarcula sp. XH51]